VLVRLGRIDQAIEYYRKSLELDPGNAKAHNNLASALSEQGKLDEAVSEFRQALKLKPDFKEAHANLSFTLFRKGEYASAWHEVHLARKYGAAPNPGLLNALSWKMPEPPE
jgi:Flp pilus assembly protein TadD